MRLALVIGVYAILATFDALSDPGPNDALPAVAPAPRSDCYGDPLPLNGIARLGSARLRHGAPVITGAFAPDNVTFVSGTFGETFLYQWEVKTGRLVAKLDGSPAHSPTMVFSSDGRFLASCSSLAGGRGSRVTAWDAATRRIRWVADEKGTVLCPVGFSPNGTFLRTLTLTGTVCDFDMATGRKLLEHETGLSLGAAYSYSFDASLLALIGDHDDTVRVWDVADKAWRCRLPGHKAGSVVVKLSKDGKLAVTIDGDDTVRIWKVDGGNKSVEIKGSDIVDTSALSPDGNLLAIGFRNKGVSILSTSTGKPLHKEVLGFGGVVAFSGDAKLLAVARSPNVIAFVSVEDGKVVSEINPDQLGEVTAVAVAPNDGVIATISTNGAVRLWNSENGKMLRTIHRVRFSAQRACFSANERTLALVGLAPTTNGPFEVVAVFYRLPECAELAAIGLGQGDLLDAAFVGDTQELACLSVSGEEAWVKIVDLSLLGQTHVRTTRTIRNTPTLARFSRHGRFVAVLGGGMVSLHETKGNGRTNTFRTPRETAAVAVSDDGATVAVGDLVGRVFIWHPTKTEEPSRLDCLKDRVTTLAFDQGGLRLFVGSVSHEMSGVWSLESGKISTALQNVSVTSAAFFTKSNKVVTGHADTTGIVWSCK